MQVREEEKSFFFKEEKRAKKEEKLSLFSPIFKKKNFQLSLFSQVVPHVTDAVQEWIERVASVPVDGKPGRPDVCVIELVSIEK